MRAQLISQRLGRRGLDRCQRFLQADPGLVGETQPRADLVGQRPVAREQGGETAQAVGRDAGFRLGRGQRAQGDDAIGTDLRQDRFQHIVLDHRRDHLGGIGQGQQAQQLVGDALARERHEAGRVLDAGGIIGGMAVQRAEARREAEIAQDAQMVFGDPGMRIADEAHAPGEQVGAAAEIIVQRAVDRVRIERVHREIAPRRILAPVGAERDGGAPPIGRDVAAQGGDLDRRATEHSGNRPVRDAGRHRLEAGALDALHHLFRGVGRRDVDILDRQSEQPVANGAAHEARLPLARPERIAQLDQAGLLAPSGGGQCVGQRLAHAGHAPDRHRPPRSAGQD